MHIKNKFLLTVLLLQPFIFMESEASEAPGVPGPTGRLATVTYSLAAITSGFVIYEHYQKIWGLNPLQEKNITAELQLKRQQIESNSIREETARAELQLKQQQVINAKTQGWRELVQLAGDTYNIGEKTGDDANEKEVDPEKIRIGLLTEVWKKILLRVQSQKQTSEEQKKEIKKLNQNTKEQLEKS